MAEPEIPKIRGSTLKIDPEKKKKKKGSFGTLNWRTHINEYNVYLSSAYLKYLKAKFMVSFIFR